MGGRGSSSGMSGGSGGSSSRDYNSNGDYIKKIDTSQFKTAARHGKASGMG